MFVGPSLDIGDAADSESLLKDHNSSDEDLACMKLATFAQRGLKKDFYDLW
ncbi:MAG: Uncharacterized protein XD58_1974 [Thermotoga sp. 50_1627]|nr:MAG: Uncharacterized protein XD58_1974 [Thermotoga sp. 50_1627]